VDFYMRKFILTSVIFAILILGSSCYFEISTTPPAPVVQTQPMVNNVVPVDPSWTSPIMSENSPVLPSIADAVQKGYPSVVTITTEQSVNDIFRRQVTQTGAGSGWILDPSGIIVTNNHVVEGASKILVQVADGKTFQDTASSVFRDPLSDLAIIKVDTSGLPSSSIGDSSKLRVGDWVVAIGNPLGNGIRAKEGTISGIKVSLSQNEDESMYDLIETSAAINPGNSGGPLLNMKGEVVGITSAKIAEVGVEGMGYAISINSAMPLLKELINKGYITRPFLGVELFTVTQYVAYYNNLNIDHGAVVTAVGPGSPADLAGLKKFDVILKYKDKEITDAPSLLRDLRDSKIGETVNIVYMRGKTNFTTSAKLTESPPPQ
jgi:serine protease Do